MAGAGDRDIGEPAFFEIGVEDPERGRAFYGALFGWELTSTGGGHQIGTAGIPGGMHGGDKGAVPWLFFRVDDMDAALARLRELGLDPILLTLPLQLLAYHAARHHGHDIDKPRNLAKSVTVE